MKWILGLLCLIFLVIFHELGHFIAAKIFGVKVESFSVGFGPVLFHKKIGQTDYRFSLFPLGGYCGMKGEKDFQKAIDGNLSSIVADKDSLYGVHPLKRAIIGFAGPFFNFIFAVIALSFIAGIGYTYYTYSNKINLSTDTYPQMESAAANAGLKSGDRIIKVNNSKIEDFSDLIQEIGSRPDENLKLLVDRDGIEIEFTVHTVLDKKTGSGKIGVTADTSEILEKHSPHYNFFQSIGQGCKEAVKAVGLTIKSLRILFMGIEMKNAVSGPARVTDMLGTAVSEGIITTLSLMAIISISLFIMNLLPIPVLDGGLILIAFIEFVFRKKIRPKIQYYIQIIGFAIIIFIFFIGLSGDIQYFISRGSK